jgi:hypothetical protein
VEVLDGEEIRENARKIEETLSAFFPQELLIDLRRINARDISEVEYFNQLVEFYNTHRLGQRVSAEDEQDKKYQPIEFICGEILI